MGHFGGERKTKDFVQIDASELEEIQKIRSVVKIEYYHTHMFYNQVRLLVTTVAEQYLVVVVLAVVVVDGGGGARRWCPISLLSPAAPSSAALQCPLCHWRAAQSQLTDGATHGHTSQLQESSRTTIPPKLSNQHSHFNPNTTNTTTSITSSNTTTTTFPAPPQLSTTHQESWWVKQLWEKKSGLRIAESGGVPLLLYSLILSFRIYRRGCRHKILISTQL